MPGRISSRRIGSSPRTFGRTDGRSCACAGGGSYAPGFEPFPLDGRFFEAGYVLSFFDDLRPPNVFSRPRRLLGSYLAPREAVRVIPTPFIGWDSNRLWQYEVALKDTCLDHAFQGIARPTAFLEKRLPIAGRRIC